MLQKFTLMKQDREEILICRQAWYSFAVVVGEDEVINGKYKLKNMLTGEQAELDIDEITALKAGSLTLLHN